MSNTNKAWLEINSQVPFAAPIYWRIQLSSLELDHLVKLSRQYETPYLAWETVRRARNPFFENGTGFEGYFIGFCHSPDEALAAIVRTGQEILDRIWRLHGKDYRFKSRMMKTLSADESDRRTMHEWSAQLGATLGRLRCNIRQNHAATAFQEETYRTVYRLPMIVYEEYDATIEQRYLIGSARASGSRVRIGLTDLKPSDQDAWRVAQYIGRFGHPLVRQFLRETSG